jgi:hypothetical protein
MGDESFGYQLVAVGVWVEIVRQMVSVLRTEKSEAIEMVKVRVVR